MKTIIVKDCLHFKRFELLVLDIERDFVAIRADGIVWEMRVETFFKDYELSSWPPSYLL